MFKREKAKIGGSHKTFIPIAKDITDALIKCTAINSISAGNITSKRTKSGSRRHVKIIDETWGILLSMTGGSSNQDIRIYVNDAQQAKLHIAKCARNNKLTISFGSRLPN